MPQDCSFFFRPHDFFFFFPRLASLSSAWFHVTEICSYNQKVMALCSNCVVSSGDRHAVLLKRVPSSLSWSTKWKKASCVIRLHNCIHFQIHLRNIILVSAVPPQSLAEVRLLQGILFDSTWLSFNLNPNILLGYLTSLLTGFPIYRCGS